MTRRLSKISRVRLIGVLAIAVFVFCSPTFSQVRPSGVDCRASRLIGGKYKVLAKGRTSNGELTLKILVRPQDVAPASLIALAARLRSDYCNEDTLSVAVFDRKEDAKEWGYDYVITHGAANRVRAVYSLDRSSGQEGFQYNLKKGEPVTECSLELGAKPLASERPGSTQAQSPDNSPCSVGSGSQAKFERISNDEEKYSPLMIDLIVTPKDQTDINLRLVATYFRSRYCHTNTIFVRMYDSWQHYKLRGAKAQTTRPEEYPRVLFFLDREQGKEVLTFSTVVGDHLETRRIAL